MVGKTIAKNQHTTLTEWRERRNPQKEDMCRMSLKKNRFRSPRSPELFQCNLLVVLLTAQPLW